MHKPRYSLRVTFAIGFTLFVLAMPIACTDPLSGGQGGGGSVDQFVESGNKVYGITQVGNVVCFEVAQCLPTEVVYIVITATQSTAWTPTPVVTFTNTPAPMATRTPTAIPFTATPATPPVITEITPISSGAKCDVESFAEQIKGSYTYLDSANYGIPQNVRSRPGISFPIVATLPKNTPVNLFWLKWAGGTRWVAITQDCHNWVSTALGTLDLD